MTDAVHSKSNTPCPWPHRASVLLLCLVFPLVWVGGMVTTWFTLAFFGLAVALAVVTSQWWHGRPAGDLEAIDPKIASGFTRWLIFTCSLVALQVLLGAWLRNSAWYDSVGLFRTVLWIHLFIAAAIFVHALMLLVTAGRGGAGLFALRRQAVWLVLLVCLQIGFGCGTWILNYSWPGWMGRFQFAARHITVEGSMSQSLTTTTHVAVGSLVLAISIQTAMRWFRIRWCQRNVSR